MNRALLVGINCYPDAPLRGCVNDISDMAKFLTTKCHFAMDDVRLLADKRATKHAIMERLFRMLKRATDLYFILVGMVCSCQHVIKRARLMGWMKLFAPTILIGIQIRQLPIKILMPFLR